MSAASFNSLNGTYSFVISAPMGNSLGVLVIHDGRVFGDDVAGSRYAGKVTLKDGIVTFDVKAGLPPDVSPVWDMTTFFESFDGRQIKHTMPLDDFVPGRPITLVPDDATIIFRRVPDETLTGPQGLDRLIQQLQRVRDAWRGLDGE